VIFSACGAFAPHAFYFKDPAMHKTRFSLVLWALLLAQLACNAVLPTPSATSIPEPTATWVVILEPTFPVATPDLPRDEAGVPRMALEGAYTAWAAGAAHIVDVRSPASYEAGHIEGAINIPLGEFETNMANIDLPKDEWIITYCT
jgi:hypothetical protein